MQRGGAGLHEHICDSINLYFTSADTFKSKLPDSVKTARARTATSTSTGQAAVKRTDSTRPGVLASLKALQKLYYG